MFGSDEGVHWVLLIVGVCLFAGIDRQLDIEKLMGEIHFSHVCSKWASRSGASLAPQRFHYLIFIVFELALGRRSTESAPSLLGPTSSTVE